jgi:hypothetical protein
MFFFVPEANDYPISRGNSHTTHAIRNVETIYLHQITAKMVVVTMVELAAMMAH